MSNIIVMAFSPRNIVGCFLKKRLTKGGGVTGTPGPPLATPLIVSRRHGDTATPLEGFIFYSDSTGER